MRIIKEGKLPGKQMYRVTCTNCKTEFEFEQDEATYSSNQRDGDCLQIACPLCKQYIYKGI